MDSTQYVRSTFIKEDGLLRSITNGLIEHDMPQISVSPEIGKTIYMLTKIAGVRNILEIGTLGGYSTIWLARALPEDGKIITLELKKKHSDFAMQNIREAGLSDKVEFLIGDAADTLKQVEASGDKFDLFFIDADKIQYRHYLDVALGMANPGALILFDNMLLQGRVYDFGDTNPAATALRDLNNFIANHPKLESMLIAIGDGLGVCRFKG